MPDAGDTRTDLFYAAVGQKIKTARVNAGMSQTALAKIVGFNRSSIANLEAGRQRIALHLFVLIAEALSSGPATLLPDIAILDGVAVSTIENLAEHLAGTPETTQDFVRGAIAQVRAEQRREGG